MTDSTLDYFSLDDLDELIPGIKEEFQTHLHYYPAYKELDEAKEVVRNTLDIIRQECDLDVSLFDIALPMEKKGDNYIFSDGCWSILSPVAYSLEDFFRENDDCINYGS